MTTTPSRSEAERVREWRLKNPERFKAQKKRRCPKKRAEWYLKNKYGITKAQYDELLKSQGFLCAICKTDNPQNYRWNVDHDHHTGKVRGLLCSNCNLLLGNAHDDTGVLTSAISYLQRPPATAVLH